MTLKEKSLQCQQQAKDIIAANPVITNIWFELNDIPIEELREAQTELRKMRYSALSKKVALQISDNASTIFAYSKEVTVKQHVVIHDVIENA